MDGIVHNYTDPGTVPGTLTVTVRDFVAEHVTPYDGAGDFLVGPTDRTKRLWDTVRALLQEERDHGGVLSIDASRISTATSHGPGYVDRANEVIVGLQTSRPLERAIKPFGGFRIVEKACSEHGVTIDPSISTVFEYRRTHNEGVFAAYTAEMRLLRSNGILTGLPDAYARGRIIGDYRRVALFGTDRLIEAKRADYEALVGDMDDERIRLREEVSDQISALKAIADLGALYGYDLTVPARNAREAVQWTYFGYLAAIKEQDGAAMSLGNLGSFFDIYIERDLANGACTEAECQELIDQFVIKLRMVRHLRPQAYSELFAGDPVWATLALSGMAADGRHKVTKTSYRFLQTLHNLGPDAEPNITVLWARDLPRAFKSMSARVSIDTAAIQFENDDLMRYRGCGPTDPGDDYGISCCVSRLTMGKQMQYFGARCNLAKALLLALNEGRDEQTGEVIVSGVEPLRHGVLEYDEVLERYRYVMQKLARLYVNTMNVIHYMHDKYYYERVQMALLDTHINRLMAFGVAGLSVAADSLSAIKYGRTTALRDERGIAIGYESREPFPAYGNDDPHVDDIAAWIVEYFNSELARTPIYRGAQPTLSVLTITSNVMYGRVTGATPDGRPAGAPFAPGANPMHERDHHGALAALNSVARLGYNNAEDGISETLTIAPSALGNDDERVDNLVDLIDGYFAKGGQHINVNVLSREKLIDVMEHPEKYPEGFVLRISGYAVDFTGLSRAHQEEIVARTCHTLV